MSGRGRFELVKLAPCEGAGLCQIARLLEGLCPDPNDQVAHQWPVTASGSLLCFFQAVVHANTNLRMSLGGGFGCMNLVGMAPNP